MSKTSLASFYQQPEGEEYPYWPPDPETISETERIVAAVWEAAMAEELTDQEYGLRLAAELLKRWSGPGRV